MTTSSVSSLFAEVKALAEKAVGQVVAQAGNYVLIAHTDWSKLEVAVSTGVAAFIGYAINKLRGIKL